MQFVVFVVWSYLSAITFIANLSQIDTDQLDPSFVVEHAPPLVVLRICQLDQELVEPNAPVSITATNPLLALDNNSSITRTATVVLSVSIGSPAVLQICIEVIYFQASSRAIG